LYILVFCILHFVLYCFYLRTSVAFINKIIVIVIVIVNVDSRFLPALMQCSNEPDIIADAFLNNVRNRLLSTLIFFVSSTLVMHVDVGSR